MTPPKPCGAICHGWDLVCDREAGHEGPHRGYCESIDAVLFWSAAPPRKKP